MKSLVQALILTAGMALAASSAAQDASVAQLQGTLSVRKADGSVRILSQRSQIESGDTISTAQGSYALIRFRDGAQVLLRPGSAVRIDSYSFSADRPQDDLFTYSLLHGGLRASTGTIGRRSASKHTLATATVGVRGKTFSVEDCVSERGEQCALHERTLSRVGEAHAHPTPSRSQQRCTSALAPRPSPSSPTFPWRANACPTRRAPERPPRAIWTPEPLWTN